MAADSRGHLVRRTQRRFLFGFLALFLAIIIVATPLIISGSLRLDLAWKLGLAPGADVEKVADGDSGQVLIVIPFIAGLGGGRTETRFHAAYLMHPEEGETRFTSLDTGETLTVPLSSVSSIAVNMDGTQLLLQHKQGLQVTNLLLDVGDNRITPLPEDQQVSALPGTWESSIWNVRMGKCEGISPQQTFVACFKAPSLSRYLAGDWQLDVLRYGQFRDSRAIYRGTGTQPVVGFTADDTWLYFQNENGIWREPVSIDDF